MEVLKFDQLQRLNCISVMLLFSLCLRLFLFNIMHHILTRPIHFYELSQTLVSMGLIVSYRYMSAHVLLSLLNELWKRDKMRGMPRILSLFRTQSNKFNNTKARILDSIYHMTL